MPEPRLTAFIIPHTHWDREWYQPFEVFRARLLDVTDAVLELLEEPSYRRFTLDGQAVILDDYLALRPEREDDLRRFVQEGRLRIGPWYVLADEFLVSPEALIRNLLLGREICQRFGSPLPVAYTPDSFGHISQLPLIAQGFGLDSIVFQRGVGDEGERLKSGFRWLAADGETEVFAVHLIGTYSCATALGHSAWELTDPYSPERAVAHVHAALYGLQEGELNDMPEWFRASLARVEGGLVRYATGDAVILLNGSDHLFPQRNLPEILQDLKRAMPEVDFVHGDVEEYVEAVKKPLDVLETYQGEFRGSRYHHILSGVLSSRIYLKQANDAAETLLERYAEPLTALAWLAGAPYPQALLTQAWKALLLNHPHDSICGCSVDPVHREMMTRFETVQQLGQELCRRALEHLAGVETAHLQDVHGSRGSLLTLFNPLSFPYQAVAEHTLELPLGGSKGLAVLDEVGRPLPLQLEVEEVYAPGRSDEKLERVTLRVLQDLPPLGLTHLRLAQGQESPGTDVHAESASDGVRLENAHLAVTVSQDGSLLLTDKASGQIYALTLALEDEADAGDSYDFSPVPGEAPLLVTQAECLTLVKAGPICATAGLEYALSLPERLSEDRQQRVGSTSLPVTLDVTLEAAIPYLKLNITIINTARDHRLRLRVGTGVKSDTVWAEGHFDWLERPVQPPAGEGWFQRPQPTQPQRHAALASDGERGVAVFSKGLPELEPIPTLKGTHLAVTLLRSVGWLSREDLLSRPQGAGPSLPAPEAQCLGAHRYELGLCAFSGDWWTSEVPKALQAFIAPPLAFAGGTAQGGNSLLELKGPLLLSSVKRAEARDSLIVRLHNPAPVPSEGRLTLLRGVKEAYTVRLDETRLEVLEPKNEIPLKLAAKAVLTLEFVLEGRF